MLSRCHCMSLISSSKRIVLLPYNSLLGESASNARLPHLARPRRFFRARSISPRNFSKGLEEERELWLSSLQRSLVRPPASGKSNDYQRAWSSGLSVVPADARYIRQKRAEADGRAAAAAERNFRGTMQKSRLIPTVIRPPEL